MHTIDIVKFVVGSLLLLVVVLMLNQRARKIVSKVIPIDTLKVETPRRSRTLVSLLLASAGIFLVADASKIITL